MLNVLGTVVFALTLVASMASPLHSMVTTAIQSRDAGRLVFAHFMVGIVSNRKSANDWDSDMQRAKAYGIDAFALNIGTDSFTDEQLGYAYQSADKNGMKVFISFDFNWWEVGNAGAVGQKISQYASLPAQLIVDGKAFVSSFAGDGLDVASVRSAASSQIHFVPNFSPQKGTSLQSLDGAMNWMGWPNNGANRAPSAGQNDTVQSGDQQYVSALSGKDYLAPVSPWFFTHYGPSVSYAKNWLFPSEMLWYDRWTELLTLGPRFVEIITWNDYGESHYVGPLDSPHYDDGASQWVNDMPHDGWLEMAKPFIAAFKAGAQSVDEFITEDQLVYWYRPQPKDVDCSATDTCMSGSPGGNYYIGPPDGWQDTEDDIFVVALLKSPGTVQVTSGSNTKSFEAKPGATSFRVPMGVGKQTFTLTRGSTTVFSETSARDIIDGCVCGIYNFNAYVGTAPATKQSSLDADGLSKFGEGMNTALCSALPSSPTQGSDPSAPPNAAPTSTQPSATTLATSTKTQAPAWSNWSVVSQPQTSTISAAVTSTLFPRPSTSATPPITNVAAQSCIAGTGPANYAGLCSFSCSYGYCPPGPCTCSAMGMPVQPPPANGGTGVPADGLDDSYLGLCDFSCSHGYCPEQACKAA